MNLHFYPNPSFTLAPIRKSVTCFLVACILFATHSFAQPATALNFDGINDHVVVPVKPALNVVNAISIEAWIKPSNNGGTQDVISKSSATANSGYIFPRTISGWSTIEFLLNFSPGGWKTLRIPYGTNKIGEWHHVAATYDGFTMRIFIDGALMGSLNFTGSINVNNNNLTIGNQPGFTEYYGGSLDDVRIYNRALSACEIAGCMNCELAGTENGLIAYYTFNQGTAEMPNPQQTTLVDGSATGANGTLTNFDLSGAASNWITGSPSVSSTVCAAVVPTTVTAGSLQAQVPIGGTVNLTAESAPGATYSWTGPNNFTSNLQNPSIQNANANASGTYTVTAIVNGCAGTSSIAIAVAPKAGGLNFDGMNDNVVVPNHPSLNSNVFSIETWIYPTGGNTAIQNVVSKANADANTGWKFPKTNDKWSTFTFELSVDRQWQTLSAGFPQSALNKWNHVAATFDGYFMRIYLNGILMNSMEVTGGYTPSDRAMTIGNNEGRVEYFKGAVDELRFWNRAISQCEIINNMQTCELNGNNNGLAQQAGLGAYYRFNQGLINVANIVNTLADSSGNGLHGALTNFALNGTESNWVDGKVNGLCEHFALPFLSASANGSVFQAGSTVTLFAVYGNNNVYNWEGPNAFSTSTQNPVLNNVQEIQAGTYTVSTPYTNCIVTASTRIKVSDLPQIVAAGPTTFCPAGSVLLSSPITGTAYQWYKNDTAINGATASAYMATQSGNYSVTVTNGTEVTVLPPLTVTVVADAAAPVADITVLPTLTLVAPVTVTTVPSATDACAGLITATTASATTFTHSGTYTIVWNYNDGNGNTSTQNQTVVVTPAVDVTAPVLTVPANITVAANEATCNAIVTFAATATDESEDPTVIITYSQNSGTAFPVGITTVDVTATDAAGNTSTGSFTVTVTAAAVAPITGTATLCAGATTALSTTTTGGTWSSANTLIASVDAMGVVTGAAAGTTDIIYTSSCGQTASLAITVKALPSVPTVMVADNCGSTVLTVPDATGTILWNTGATGSSITVTSAGNYSVSQEINGCVSASAQAIASPKPIQVAPVITATKNCGSTTLSSDMSGVWSNGATGFSTAATADGSYTQTVTNSAGCSASATIEVTVDQYPTVSGIIGNTSVPEGATTQLSSATTGGVWSSNSAVATVNASGLVTGITAGVATITYTVTSAAGCSTAVSSVVTVICTAPVFTGAASDITINASPAQCAAAATYTAPVSGTAPALTYVFTGATSGSGSGTGSGTAFNVGTTFVTLNAVNNCGSASTTFSVIVKDVTAPIAITKNITIALDANGNATVTPAQVNNGSTDNCGAITLAFQSPTNPDGTISFGCSQKGDNTVTLTVTDASGNTSSQTAVVTVVDDTAPTVTAVPAQVFCGSAGSYSVPALVSNDNCAVTSITYAITGATNRTGTGSNASGMFNMGASTITWTVKDAANNVTTSTTAVSLSSVPVASIVADSVASDFCSERVLTGYSSVSGTTTYKWMYGSNISGTANQFSLGQNNAEGVYNLVVTTNGCPSGAASYLFNKQTMLSSYTIFASGAVVIGKNNKVASGSVGVSSLLLGSATFKGNTAVNGPNSFVKALLIFKNPSDTISRSINGLASVTGMPAMQPNTSNFYSYPTYATAQNSTVTLSGNYKTLLIRKGTYATLTGTIFGTIELEAGASVLFTSATINIDKLLVDDGLGDGNYSYVRFSSNANVRVSTQVSIGNQVRVNPDNYIVTFIMGDNWIDSERFIVKGADTRFTGNIIMPNGKLLVTSTDCDDDSRSNCNHLAHTLLTCAHLLHNHKACDHNAHNASDCKDDVYMTGTFLVAYAESKGNTVIWNSFQCGSAPVPVTMLTQTSTPATTAVKPVTTENTATTTEEDFKVTVMPNPSTTYFTLKFESRYATPINMRVMDVSGRVVDVKNKIGSNSSIKAGENYASGTYYAEMIQGNKRKWVQLIKAGG